MMLHPIIQSRLRIQDEAQMCRISRAQYSLQSSFQLDLLTGPVVTLQAQESDQQTIAKTSKPNDELRDIIPENLPKLIDIVYVLATPQRYNKNTSHAIKDIRTIGR